MNPAILNDPNEDGSKLHHFPRHTSMDRVKMNHHLVGLMSALLGYSYKHHELFGILYLNHNGTGIALLRENNLTFIFGRKEKSMKATRNILIIGFVLVLAGFAVAFADGGRWGGGYGYMTDYCPGYGMGPARLHGPGYGMGPGMMSDWGNGPRGYGANLTQEQREKLDAAREKFYSETEKLRDQLRDKQYALRTELSKNDPDDAKAGQLQKELSQLESEFDQKAVQHRLEVRKILPGDVQHGFGYGRGAANGRGCGW
ncbi:MAG: periplasmic heavy metal sensor [Desulfobacteraceae bacterium]|nr:MAG: periplasmic heavy metal sensor [Desulfobacteraceae bacterium]